MNKPLSYEDFVAIYSKVPRLNVELIIVNEHGVLLTKRSKYAWKGYWHVPGGTVYYGESFEDAVRRIARGELGREVSGLELVGTITYPSGHKNDEFTGWPMGVAFKVELMEGDIVLNDEASEARYFDELPENLIEDQRDILARILKGGR